MKLQPLLAGVMVFCIGTVPVTFGANFSGSDKEQIQEQGQPVPGTAGDQESTKKQRDPSKSQGAEKNAQVTMGGSKSTISGEIRKIENEYFFVKDEESGDEVRLLVNKDTNMDCSAASTEGSSQAGITKQQSKDQSASEASERQKEQGQKQDETAMGSGFKIGDCAFNSGDKIKAEVDDNGRVTMLKYVSKDKEPSQMARSTGESAGMGELAKPGQQDKPGQLDMTGGHAKEYAILPIPQGEFKATSQHALANRPVKDPQGKTVGMLQSLIMDSSTGQVEYAVIQLEDKKTLREVPWKHLQTKQGSKGKELVLNTRDYPLDPGLTGKEGQDRSPEIAKLLKDMEHAVAVGDLREDHPQKSASASKGRDARLIPPKDVKGEVVRGRVLKIDGQMYLIKERSGKEVQLRVDKQTQKGQVNLKDEPFKIGDRVEAYMTPDGHAFSISLTRGQGGIPGDPDAGG